MSPQVEALRDVVFEAIRIIQLLDDRTLDTGDGEAVDLLQVIERWDGVLDSVDEANRKLPAQMSEDRDLEYTVKLEQEFSAMEARHGALHAALRKIAISDFKEEMRDEAMSAIEADTPRKEAA